MKRIAIRALLALSLAGILVGASAADEISEIYQLIYDQAESLAEKHLAIVNLLDIEDPSTAP
ncbi:MAG: hypothetical protein Q8M76_17510, partial [Spirochaetaceae bacterium]|nr:hypothetical protein [Spirochaetaceae bacterium]